MSSVIPCADHNRASNDQFIFRKLVFLNLCIGYQLYMLCFLDILLLLLIFI